MRTVKNETNSLNVPELYRFMTIREILSSSSNGRFATAPAPFETWNFHNPFSSKLLPVRVATQIRRDANDGRTDIFHLSRSVAGSN